LIVQAVDNIQLVYAINDIEDDEEWVHIPPERDTSFHVCITLDSGSRLQTPLIVEAEVQVLIFENIFGSDVIIYTDGSVIRHVRNSWAYTVRREMVMEDSVVFALTTICMTI
jgi:hypothetical protein